MYSALFLYWAVFSIVFLLVASGILLWLWNMTLPELFGFKEIRYGQAFRLLLISGLLFGPGLFLRFGM